jgi:hypothetical protein
MWLFRATGDPHRKIRIEFDPDSGADVIRPASTFHFPACEPCNRVYGKTLEAQAKAAMEALFKGRSLRVSQCYRLLDWLDKVRVGLWLGYHALHKELFPPKFRISARIGVKDRIAIISVDPKDDFRGLQFGGFDNNIFRTSQAAIYLRINNVKIISASFDSLISQYVGVPYIKELFQSEEHPNLHVRSLELGDYDLKQDWGVFSPPGATVLAQAVCWPSQSQKNVVNIFFNEKMIRKYRHLPRISKPEHFDRFFPTQVISNFEGRFQFCSNKDKRIRFRKALHHDDSSLLRHLYLILFGHVLPVGPCKVINAAGERHGTVFLSMLYVEKALQMIFRLEKVGAMGHNAKRYLAMKDYLINEVDLLTRMREESQSHVVGTCDEASSRLFI